MDNRRSDNLAQMAMGSKTAVFRLATINVHSFRNALFRNNVQELVTILKPLHLDFLAVQEVHNDHNWPTFCQNLGLNYFIFDANYGNYLGNGIASRHPIIFQHAQSINFPSPGGKRSILECRLGGDHPFVEDRLFGVTHLDHISEDARLAQIRYFQPHKKNIDILIGDMNSLSSDDYSDRYYRATVAGIRERSGWEKPRFELTDLIQKQWNYQDAFKLINPQAKDNQVVTCAYGTRIDYIYLRPRQNNQWRLTNCSIINTQPATDHNAVFAEFQRNV
jgi:endonuclease/exonuclease/phosphatase family metal-dependent hydrolase